MTRLTANDPVATLRRATIRCLPIYLPTFGPSLDNLTFDLLTAFPTINGILTIDGSPTPQFAY